LDIQWVYLKESLEIYFVFKLFFTGGALAVHVAKECPSMIKALCVIDVVEGEKTSFSYRIFSLCLFIGSALESLNSMQCFLTSRPKQFSTPQQAIEYMVRSGQVRNVESARVSIIGQIQPIVTTIQSNETDSSTIPSNSTIPVVSHLCETVQEEEEEEEDNEQKSSINIQQSTTANDTNKYTWRIDLSKTEQFWKGWFSGL